MIRVQSVYLSVILAFSLPSPCVCVTVCSQRSGQYSRREDVNQNSWHLRRKTHRVSHSLSLHRHVENCHLYCHRLELACRKLPVKKRIVSGIVWERGERERVCVSQVSIWQAVLEFVSHKLGVSRATTIKRVRQVMKKREVRAYTCSCVLCIHMLVLCHVRTLQEEALAQPLQKLKHGKHLPVC